MKIQEDRKVRLKRPFWICAVLCGAAFGLQATPVCATSGTYATLIAYNADGGCTIADKTFSDFTFSPTASGGATALSSSGADVSYTVEDSPSANAYGFLFAAPLAAGPGQTNDLLISYDVSVTSGPSLINDAQSTISGMADSVISGGFATASIAETVCLGHVIAGCTTSTSLGSDIVSTNGTPVTGPATSTANFNPGYQTVGILKDIDLFGGTGYATLSGFSNTVSQTVPDVPEPGFYGVLAGGIGAVLMFARRRKKTL
jgi:hypothetical protein